MTLSTTRMSVEQRKSKSDINLAEKWAIIARSIQFYDHEKNRMTDGSVSKLTQHFNVSQRTIQRILAEYFEKISDGTVYPDLSPSDRSDCGVPSKLNDEVTANIISLHNMTNGEMSIKQMSQLYLKEFGVKISNTSMHRYLKQIESKTRTSFIKRAHPVTNDYENGDSSSSSSDDSNNENSSRSLNSNDSIPAESVDTSNVKLSVRKNSKKRNRA